MVNTILFWFGLIRFRKDFSVCTTLATKDCIGHDQWLFRWNMTTLQLTIVGLSTGYIHTEKSLRNLIKSNRNQIVFTIFRLIWIQTDVRLVLNQLGNVTYNMISGWFQKDLYVCRLFFRSMSPPPLLLEIHLSYPWMHIGMMIVKAYSFLSKIYNSVSMYLYRKV